MKVSRNETIDRWRVRYCLAIAGTIIFAQLGFAPVAVAEFSAANFKNVWAQEFGLGSETPAPPVDSGFRSVPPATMQQPHPAVARIVVPEGEATSMGSGTLVDLRDGYGIVVTNWHVVRDAQAPIEVIFPNGFTSKARALKVDSDWDLAALVIYEPKGVQPVKIAPTAPQPGDQLTICGYGPGIYRSVTGRCTQYYSPKEHLPQQMVELNVEARQGDSGGPILNSNGELAGVLFGAGNGTTMGSFGGRVGEFLASLAPDIGRPTQAQLVSAQTTSDNDFNAAPTANPWQSNLAEQPATKPATTEILQPPAFDELQANNNPAPAPQVDAFAAQSPNMIVLPEEDKPLFEKIKSGLAALGLFAIVVMFLKAAG